MSSCGSCRSGRCGDFSSKAVGLPSLAAIDVVERILLQAVKNTAQRSVDASEGKLSRQDLVDADLKLVTWLTDTFAGRNLRDDRNRCASLSEQCLCAFGANRSDGQRQPLGAGAKRQRAVFCQLLVMPAHGLPFCR